jgi:hypothetical protein
MGRELQGAAVLLYPCFRLQLPPGLLPLSFLCTLTYLERAKLSCQHRRLSSGRRRRSLSIPFTTAPMPVRVKRLSHRLFNTFAGTFANMMSPGHFRIPFPKETSVVCMGWELRGAFDQSNPTARNPFTLVYDETKDNPCFLSMCRAVTHSHTSSNALF